MISRRRVARSIAELLEDNPPAAVAAATAEYFREHQLSFDHDLLSADVARFALERGSLNVSVTTARELASETLQLLESDLKARTDATHIFIKENVEPTVIGGMRLRGPELVVNDTIIDRIKRLKD